MAARANLDSTRAKRSNQSNGAIGGSVKARILVSDLGRMARSAAVQIDEINNRISHRTNARLR